ncbi:universal stress protein [Streptomyces antibioticus]|uniref:universal stress protein n=1 Tax=Streptomyces antibioticus TaxID=1890 RepID=UPI0033CDFE47
MSRTLTVGLDGSRVCMEAVRWAAWEASRRRLALKLVHVWDIRPDVHTPLVGRDTEYHRPEWSPRRVAARVRDAHPGLDVETAYVCGDPVETLCDLAQEEELLVLGSRGLGAVAGYVLGSVSLSVVAHASRPVVLVRAQQESPGLYGLPTWQDSGPVVVGVNLAAGNDEVLEFAFAHAARHGRSVRVVHSWSPPPFCGADSTPSGRGLTAGVATAKDEALIDALQPWRHKFPSVPVTTLCRLGRPARDLVDASRDAGLVVVGCRTRRAQLGAHLGSVTHAVLHHCESPVAVVPHEDA